MAPVSEKSVDGEGFSVILILPLEENSTLDRNIPLSLKLTVALGKSDSLCIEVPENIEDPLLNPEYEKKYEYETYSDSL
jgi:hypothetical protein